MSLTDIVLPTSGPTAGVIDDDDVNDKPGDEAAEAEMRETDDSDEQSDEEEMEADSTDVAQVGTAMHSAFMYWRPLASHSAQGDHSPGKPGKVREFQSGQGKVRENGKVRVTEICVNKIVLFAFILEFERAEKLKLQLLPACGPGVGICSSLVLL